MERNFKTINGKTYEFVCNYWETRNAWGHECSLFEEERYTRTSYARARYYNRTWESYPYQTVMMGAVNNELERVKERVIDEWKYINNKKRITKTQKEQLWANCERIKELNELYNSL